jgi:hypothetical protein
VDLKLGPLHPYPAVLFRRTIVLCFTVVLGATRAGSQLVPCNRASDGRRIASALAEIERGVDPCGESAQVIELLQKLKSCSKMTYQICTSSQISRNVFDRPFGKHGEVLPRTITWNPVLRSELGRGCDGDPAKPVLRDPTASLLHELVHAAHDCQGINPGEHESEAVRIENIYRRAAGLCQRTTYGDDPLPSQLVKNCAPSYCPCSPSGDSGEMVRSRSTPVGSQGGNASTGDERLGDSGAVAKDPSTE